MTALTALRTNLKKKVKPEIITDATTVTSSHRQRIIDETYPELSLLGHEKKDYVKLRRSEKPSLPATIEDASEDDDVCEYYFTKFV